MYACIRESRRGFFEGRAGRRIGHSLFATYPHPAICRWFYVSAVRPLVPAAANLCYVHCGFIAICHYGGVGHYHGRRNEAVRSNRCWEANRRTCGRGIIAKFHPSTFSGTWTSTNAVTTEETREVCLWLSWTGTRGLLLIRVLLRGFIQRVEELVALGYGYLQAVVRFLTRLAFSDESSTAPVRHGTPILSVTPYQPDDAPVPSVTSDQPDFSGVWAKIERAKEHLDTLRRETGLGIGYPIPDIYQVPMRLEYEPDTGYHVFRATATLPEDAIRRIGILVGDAVHNLRSALDHLFWQLALVHCDGEMPWDEREQTRIQFPISDTPKKLKNTGRSKYVASEHWTIIEGHQPYSDGFDEAHAFAHPLARLRQFSNTDKHRVITPVTVLTNRHTDLVEFFQGFGGELVDLHIPTRYGHDWLMEQDAEVVRVKVRPASLQLNLEVAGYVVPNPSVIDGFPEGFARIVPLDGVLYEMIHKVLEVVRDFHKLSY
jgi:hypothetical protein